MSTEWSLRIAVEGCGHGELDGIYQAIQETETVSGKKVDLLLMCGDLQTLRDERDLDALAVPKKYRRLGDFHDYYTGKKKAPLLTLFVGGNHEASNYLSELYHGGWVAPNIYFLGYAGHVKVGGLSIGAISGIFKGHDFWKGHFERAPYNDSTIRSVYHVRAFEIFRLSLVSTVSAQRQFLTQKLSRFVSPDIVLSHDWPQGIEHFGDLATLLARKPFFKQDVQSGSLGSPPLMLLLKTLRPRYWFSAHLHVKFAALVRHEDASGMAKVDNPDEIVIDEDEDDHVNDDEKPGLAPIVPDPTRPGPARYPETQFLALGKCAPRQQFLQILEIPTHEAHTEPLTIELDRTWLAILRTTQHLFSSALHQKSLPEFGSPDFEKMVEEVVRQRAWLDENLPLTNNVLDYGGPFAPSQDGRNPQTRAFEERIGL